MTNWLVGQSSQLANIFQCYLWTWSGQPRGETQWLNGDSWWLNSNLVGALEHEFYFSIYCEFHHPN